MQNTESESSEMRLLHQILKSQINDFDRLEKALLALDQSDPKFVTLTNLKNRVAKSMLAVVLLIRDPRLVDLSDDIKRTKHDIASLIKKVREMENEDGKGKIPPIPEKT